MALVIRHPTPEEDLSPFFDVEHCPLKWNCEQVYVAADGTRLVGIALLFDGGHPLVMVEYVRVLSPWEGRGVAWRLLRRICADMRDAGKIGVLGYVNGTLPAQISGMADLDGADVGPMHYRLLRKYFF